MPVYMQATIRAVPGKLPKLQETLLKMFPILEANGWKLHGCFVHATGLNNTITDLWEMDDMEHMKRARAAMARHADFPEIRKALDECVRDEELIFMDRFR